MKALVKFLQSDDLHNLTIANRLVALIWYYQANEEAPVEFTQMVEDYNSSGYGVLNNKTKMCMKLHKDKRTASLDKGKSFSIHVTAMKLLDDQFSY